MKRFETFTKKTSLLEHSFVEYKNVNPFISINGYRVNIIKLIFVWILILLTGGLFGLFLYWKKVWYLNLTYSTCPLNCCTKILVQDQHNIFYVEDILEFIIKDEESVQDQIQFYAPFINGCLLTSSNLRLFMCCKLTYIYNDYVNNFIDVSLWALNGIDVEHLEKLANFNKNIHKSNFIQNKNLSYPLPPKSWRERKQQLLIFGQNDLYIPVPGFFRIMYDEVVTPFYAFQAFSIILWYTDDYWIFATCVAIISFLTLFKSTYDIRQERLKLNKNLSIARAESKTKDKANEPDDQKIEPREGTILVERYIETKKITDAQGDKAFCHMEQLSEPVVIIHYERIPIIDLIPGDVIVIEPEDIESTVSTNTHNKNKQTFQGYCAPCDAILLRGTCITDECMLTGESVPVHKSNITELKWCEEEEADNNNMEMNIPIINADANDSRLIKNYDRNSVISKHVIFNGTRILQISPSDGIDSIIPYTKYTRGLRAFVVATGYNTSKGRMVKDFLYPAPSIFKFDQDSFKFIGALFSIALLGFTYSLTLKIIQRVPLKQVIIRSLDLIAIVVPPALPAAMTAGLIFAQKRLKKEQAVLSLSPEKINACGALDVLCFDKTGTLTHDGLDITGILPICSNNKENDPSNNAPPVISSNLSFCKNLIHKFYPNTYQNLNMNSDHELNLVNSTVTPLATCCAICHSIVKIGTSFLGDPLETKMFEFSGWTYSDPYCSPKENENTSITNSSGQKMVLFTTKPPLYLIPDLSQYLMSRNIFKDPGDAAIFKVENIESLGELDKFEYGVIHRYPFIPDLQRMSVIARCLSGSSFEIYCKGSPEVIKTLSLQDTIPIDFSERLDEMTNQGYRVIACARKTLINFNLTCIKKYRREELEKDLEFLGFLIFQNKLKEKTTPTMDILNEAGFKNVMVTGDNLLTALSIAKDCHLIPRSISNIYVVKATLGIDNNEKEAGTIVISLTNRQLQEHPGNDTINEDSAPTIKKLATEKEPPNKAGFWETIYLKFIYSWLKINGKTSYEFSKDKDPTYLDEKSSQSFRGSRITDNFKNRLAIFDPHIFYNRARQYFLRAPLKHFEPTTVKVAANSHLILPPREQCSLHVENTEQRKRFLRDWVVDMTTQDCGLEREGLPYPKLGASAFQHSKEILPSKYFAMDGLTFNLLADLSDEQSSTSLLNDINTLKISIENSLGHDSDDLANHKYVIYQECLETISGTAKTNLIFDHSKLLNNSDSSQISLLVETPVPRGDPELHVGKNNVYSNQSKGLVSQNENRACTKGVLNSFLVDNCCVFARMNPESKTRLVHKFQEMDYFVGMCGDGANDCGALKAAHMGVSLAPYTDDNDELNSQQPGEKSNRKKNRMNATEGTASLAAPFTATRSDISCVPGIIREGRASLATSFAIFKNMACYSLNQFLACLSLYWFGTNFSDFQFTLADIFPATVLSILMGYTKPCPILPKIAGRRMTKGVIFTTKNEHSNTDRVRFEKYKPDTSLALARHIGSVIGHILINISFLSLAIVFTYKQAWCVRDVKPIIDYKNPFYPHLVAAVFFVTFFQYLIFTVVFSKGPPFRKSYFSNVPLCITTLVVATFVIYLALREPFTYPILSKFFKLTYPPPHSELSFGHLTIHFTSFYLILAAANFLVSSTFEHVLLDGYLGNVSRKRNLFLQKIRPPSHATLKTFSETFL